ncbi:hypothetical protein CPER28S_02266 [Cellulomonas persica]
MPRDGSPVTWMPASARRCAKTLAAAIVGSGYRGGYGTPSLVAAILTASAVTGAT